MSKCCLRPSIRALVGVGLFAFSCCSLAKLPSAPNDQPSRTAVVLNYCTQAIVKMQQENNRLVVENEYHQIFDNINLGFIPPEASAPIRELADKINRHLQRDEELTSLARAQARIQEAVLTEMFLEKLSVVDFSYFDSLEFSGVEASQSTYSNIGKSIHLLSSAVSVSANLANEYYRRLHEASQSFSERSLELRKEEIDDFHQLRVSYFGHYLDLVNDGKLSDQVRVTESDYEAFLLDAKTENPVSAYVKLVRGENIYQYIPEYWHQRAILAHALFEKDSNQRYANDIAYCREQYRFFDGFLRRDPYKSMIEILYLSTATLSADEALSLVQGVLDQDPNNGNKILFAALLAYQYGKIDQALKWVEANIVMDKVPVMSRALLVEIRSNSGNFKESDRLFTRVIADEKLSAQEFLFMLSADKDERRFATNFKTAISGITVDIDKSMYGNDIITLNMPVRWVLDPQGGTSSKIIINGKRHDATDIETDSERLGVKVSFKVIDYDELVEKHGADVSIIIPTQYYPLRLDGQFVERSKADERIVAKVSNFVKNVAADDEKKTEASVKVLHFNPSQICSGTACFDWKTIEHAP